MQIIKTAAKRLIKDIKTCRVALILIFVYLAATEILFGMTCPMRILFDVPCPGCGLTSAVTCILTGRIVRAWELNATAYLWLPLLLVFIFFRYFRGKLPRIIFPVTVVVAVVTMVNYFYRLSEGLIG